MRYTPNFRTCTIALISTALLSVGLLTGCGEDEDDKAAASDALAGTWVADCSKDSDSSYTEPSLEFKNGTVAFTHNTYSDAGCTTKTMTFVLESTYKLGNAYEAGTKIDITTSKMTMTIYDDLIVESYNAEDTCGADFFTKGTPKEIKTADCDGIMGATDVVSYQIYKVTGDELQLGDTTSDDTDSSAEAKRPKALEATKYKKK